MDTTRIVGLSLLVPAAALFAWRVRNAPRARDMKLGRVELKLNPARRVDIPILASVAATFLGGGILALERSGLFKRGH